MTARAQVELPELQRLREIAHWLSRFSDDGQHKRIPGPQAGQCYEANVELTDIANKLAARLAESEARAAADAAEIANLRQLCRDMLPVFQAARPMVLNLERLKDAAIAQEAEREAQSA